MSSLTTTEKGDDDKTPKNPTSDEELRKLLKPCPHPDDIIEAIKLHYTQPGSPSKVVIVKQLDSYDDVNYLITLNDVKYVVKIHNGVESDAYLTSRRGTSTPLKTSPIDLQNTILHHLHSSHSLPVPHPLPPCHCTPSPTLPVVSSPHSPRKLVVRLLHWVEGEPLSSLPSFPLERLSEAGAFLGKIRRAMDELNSHPEAVSAATRYHAWDGRRTSDVKEFVGCIDAVEKRALVEGVLEEFERRREVMEREFRKVILMGDYNDANIIVRGGRVVGVIDFGDSVYSWRVLDISVAMAYAMLSSYAKPHSMLSAAAAMLRGFHHVYPLTPTERQHLHLLVACRLACSVTLGALSYQKNPENKYLLLHAAPAWKALDLLWNDGCERGDIQHIFDVACDDIVEPPKENPWLYDCSSIAFPDPCVTDPLESSRRRSHATDATMSSSSSLSSPKTKKLKMDDTTTTTTTTTVTFVTGNKKKLHEVQRILLPATDSSSSSNLPFTITNHKLDLPELQGDDTSDIAREKCALAAQKIGGPVIIEDTSLCFNALRGLPGPYIKWFLDKCRLDGLVDLLSAHEDKTAYAQTIVAYCEGEGREVRLFEGRTEGTIVRPRGDENFGWDPIFEPTEGEGGKTYAEMEGSEKDAISHRRKALELLKKFLWEEKKNGGERLDGNGRSG